MHIVTKILIVACAVFSLLLSALAISYTANARAVGTALKNERALRAAADQSASSVIQHQAEQDATHAKRLQSLENDVADREKKISDLQAQSTDLRSQLEQARADSASIKGQIGQLGVTVETQASLIKNYRDEVTTLREAMLKSQKREIELVDHVNELESNREVLQQNARALKEQLEETKLALQNAQSPSGGTSSTGPVATVLSGPVVRANVVSQFTTPAGEPMVVISEGSNRGIRENTLMSIIRGTDQFVGELTIVKVEPERAVGRVNTLGKPISAQSGDVVLSRLN